MVGLAFFSFLMAIVNLGDLGLVLGAMQHAVQGASRQAAVTAAANLSSNGSKTTCPTTSDVQGYFNNYAASVLNASAITLSYGSASSGPWINDGAASPAGTYIALTAAYVWQPIGLPKLGSGLTLKLTSVAFVMGSGAAVTC